MSLNSLTDETLRLSLSARRRDRPPEAGGEAVGAGEAQENSASSAIAKLVKYIPTESVTLYVAALAAKGAIMGKWKWIDEKTIYWFFACLTPILWMLIYVAKRKAEKLPPLPPLSVWLVWNLVASFVAFLVWALAVPGGPYFQAPGEGALAGFLAVFISSVLSLIELLIDKPAE